MSTFERVNTPIKSGGSGPKLINLVMLCIKISLAIHSTHNQKDRGLIKITIEKAEQVRTGLGLKSIMISLVEANEANDPCETDRNLPRIFLFVFVFVCEINELGLASQPILGPRGRALLFRLLLSTCPYQRVSTQTAS